MAPITERVEAHYEAREVPFGTVYEWHPAYVALECDCGETLILTATSTITACHRCGADLGGFVHDIQEREGRLPDKLIHPWFYDAQARARQRLSTTSLALRYAGGHGGPQTQHTRRCAQGFE